MSKNRKSCISSSGGSSNEKFVYLTLGGTLMPCRSFEPHAPSSSLFGYAANLKVLPLDLEVSLEEFWRFYVNIGTAPATGNVRIDIN